MATTGQRAVTVATLTLLLAACGSPEHHEVHWGYEGEGAPEHWASLSPDFATCDSGVEQSPIDLVDAVPIDDPGIIRHLGEAVLTGALRAHVLDLIDNGHTVQVTNDAPISMGLGGTVYELVQFHFHAPSEHTIDGQHAPLEVHFVHKSAASELAVVGILVEEGEHDAMWDAVVDAFPDKAGGQRHVENLDLDMNDFRPLPQHYYRYEGSLTTPPCSEGVHWIVMAELRQISPQQMAKVVSLLHDNNRPVQPIGNRQIGLVWHDEPMIDPAP
ncbi:MAG: carbonic anhydrase [Woeseiaceae bacterium]